MSKFDKLLIDNFELWHRAYKTNNKALKKEVQLNTLPFHNQRCECVNQTIMNKLKYVYKKMGLFTNQ